MNATRKMANYIRTKGFSIKAIATATNLPVSALYKSFQTKVADKNRPLRVDEFLAICAFLEVNPFDFRDAEIKTSEC